MHRHWPQGQWPFSNANFGIPLESEDTPMNNEAIMNALNALAAAMANNQTTPVAPGAAAAESANAAAVAHIEEQRNAFFKRMDEESAPVKVALMTFLEECGFIEPSDVLLQADKLASSAAYGYFSTRNALERSAMAEVRLSRTAYSNGVEGLSIGEREAVDMADRQASMKARCEANLRQYFAANAVARDAMKELRSTEYGEEQLENLLQYLRAPSIDATDKAYVEYVNGRERKRAVENATLRQSAQMSAVATLFS
jgi:hypothetical protein